MRKFIEDLVVESETKFSKWKIVGRCDILNVNTENKLLKRVLVPVNSLMIAIKSWVNKNYTIQFSIKSWKGCGVWRFLGGQGLRAILCCRKISDSIFWLYHFTPCWLAGAMPCPKKVRKKYAKRKDRNR